MGKIFSKDKLKRSLSFVLLFLLVAAYHSYAASRDVELLNKGYGYYLSYQPKKAVEEFNTFLKEFPQSSARDTALYWLGMSYLQLKEFDEARKVFSDLKENFPASPFFSHADKELETIMKMEYPQAKANESQVLKNKQDGNVESSGDSRKSGMRTSGEKKMDLVEEEKKEEKLTARVKVAEKDKMEDQAVPGEAKDLEKEKIKSGGLLTEKTVDKKRAEEIQAKVEAKVRELEQEEKKAVEDKEKKKLRLEEEEKKPKELPDMIKELEEEKKKTEVVLARLKLLAGEHKKADDLEVKDLEKETKKTEDLQIKLKELDEANEKVGALQAKIKELEEENRKAKGLQEKIINLNEEKERVGALQAKIRELEEKTKQTEELRSKVKELEEAKKKADELQAKLRAVEEEKQKISEPAVNQIVQQSMPDEGKKNSEELKAKIQELAEEKKKSEELHAKVRELEGKESYLQTSAAVLNKLGMKDVLWRSGNIREDLANEDLLYQEAKKLHITEDLKKQKELTRKYKFNPEQEAYLGRYLTICNFIDWKLQDMPAEDVFEQLIVDYDEETRYTKIVLASELQTQAKSGMSFEEIYKLYPDLITLEITSFDELPDWIREKVGSMAVGEFGVVWSEEGYRILKRTVKPALNSCGEIRPEARDKIKTYIADLLKEIKEGTKSNGDESGG